MNDEITRNQFYTKGNLTNETSRKTGSLGTINRVRYSDLQDDRIVSQRRSLGANLANAQRCDFRTNQYSGGCSSPIVKRVFAVPVVRSRFGKRTGNRIVTGLPPGLR